VVGGRSMASNPNVVAERTKVELRAQHKPTSRIRTTIRVGLLIVTDQPDSIPYQPLEIILIPPTPYVISSPLGEVSTLFPANNSLLRYISSRRPTRLQTQACQWTHPSPLPHLEPLLQHTATPSSLARTRAMPILHETFVPAKRPWRITVLISGSGG
jgi:hypothetical protein